MRALGTVISPAPARDPSAGHRRLPAAAALLAAWVLLAGCAAGGGPARTGGGLAQADALSLVVAQTRAQFPELSAVEVPFGPRPSPTAEEAGPPELVLQGEGVSLTPGVQVGEPTRVRFALYLSKPGYGTGCATLAPAGEAEETWRVVAYDQRGSAGGGFEFLYVLAAPDGTLRYLAAIGGAFERDGKRWHGFEGTAVVPSPATGVTGWRRAYKIDLGKAFPAEPAFAAEVDAADDLYGRLRREVAALERLKERAAAARAELARLEGLPPPPEPAARQAALAGQQGRVERLAAELKQRIAAADQDFRRYYALRHDISRDFAAFQQTNAYRWLRREAQQAHYRHWQRVERHHPEVEQVLGRLVALLENPRELLDARTRAMTLVERNNNWEKDPARKPPPAPCGPGAQPPAKPEDSRP